MCRAGVGLHFVQFEAMAALAVRSFREERDLHRRHQRALGGLLSRCLREKVWRPVDISDLAVRCGKGVSEKHVCLPG